MIIKELDPLELNDKFEQAGYSAESQLAFYLKREFKTDPHILIFNHLRFEKAGDVCQIDHLVLHQYGMVIIESKSVTTRIEINELGEWKRCFNNTWRGMPSPVLQAQRQGKFLREYLEDNVEKLLNKLIFGKQVHFTKMPIDVLVAISDSGIINRPQNNPLDNVCKADQIADKVKAKVAEYRKKNGLLSLSDPVHEFNKDEIQRISKFLLAHHKPAKAKASLTITDPKPTNSPLLDPQNSFSISTPLITPEKLVLPQKKVVSNSLPNTKTPEPISKPVAKVGKTVSPNICLDCQSENISILYGRNYYFKCHDCNKNMAIKNICPQCGDLEKTRKSGLQFFTECLKCGTSRLFHTNSSSTIGS